MLPHADRIEAIDRGPRQGEVAFVIAGLLVGARRGGLNQGGGNARRVQCNRQAGANQATADDQHTVSA